MTEVERESSFIFSRRLKGPFQKVKCQLYVALDQEYIDERKFREISALATETASMIGGLMITYVVQVLEVQVQPV
jgi:hypothetical protein